MSVRHGMVSVLYAAVAERPANVLFLAKNYLEGTAVVEVRF